MGNCRQRDKARQFRCVEHQLVAAPIDGCWLLDLSPGSPFWPQLRRVGFLRQSLTFTGAYFVQHFLFLFSWWVIGRAVFQGRIEMGWLAAWALILFSLLPLRALSVWLQGLIAVNLGGLLQRRLLLGATRLHPDEIRHEGVGQLMGRVFESEAIETVSLNGGIRGLTAIIEIIMAGWVLAVGAGGIGHALLLLLWIGIISGILVVFYKRRYRWTVLRRGLTHYLVEVMVGHRTRLAQSLRRFWHRGEDDDLAEYVKVLDSVDRVGIILEVFISHGWLVVGLLGLVPAFVAGSSPAALAISLGGVLSAESAFRKFALGLVNQLMAGMIAWDQIKPLFVAAARPEVVGDVNTAVSTTPPSGQLLGVHGVSFRYNVQGDQVLDQCSLHVQAGDHILLEGSSGGGKSTLAAVLTGLRQPDSGLVLWQGLDRMTLGSAGWRRRVVFAPQFHENHVLGTTFMFNLLMGRRWPPRREDVVLAQELCAELGLSDVLARMPAGMLQTVGETGWQLSHGEKSRLYIARAILQGVDFLILDESFAALDPHSLQRAMACVRERAPTLLVIAHP
ncbi:MAG: ABC transporter ATP-binding protein [Ardenticatenaceae bacterium]|nr:ABC transporter ATP-binding protein [Ardenticatenaceae bacterium]